MIIDFHTHAFPEKVAEKAIPKLANMGGLAPYGDGTASGLLKRMDEWGIDRAVILSIATNPKQQKKVNDFAIETNAAHERLTALGSINPYSENIAAEAKRLRDAGIAGIKIHPDFMGVHLDAPEFDPIFRACIENGLFVITHAGRDFSSPEHIHCTPEMILRVTAKYPDLTMVAAHMGGNRMWDDAERLLIGKNLYIETSLAPMEGLSCEQCRRMLTSHDPDKLLFGSDFPWYTMEGQREYLEKLELSPELEEKIYRKNALTLLNVAECV